MSHFRCFGWLAAVAAIVSCMLWGLSAVPAWASEVVYLASENSDNFDPRLLVFVLLAAGPITYVGIRLFYRNTAARHHYETETEAYVDDMQAVDELIDHKIGTTDSKLPGDNSRELRGNLVDTSLNPLEKTVSKIFGS